MFASNTRMQEPESIICPLSAKKLAQRLDGFWQWSELSERPRRLEELFPSCKLDNNGEVSTPAEVTELTGESYVAGAVIYLHCPLLR